MTSRFRIFAVAVALAASACASLDTGAFLARYKTETGAIAQTLTATTTMLQAGATSPGEAGKVLATAEKALLALSLARTFQAPLGGPEFDAALAAVESAKKGLMAMLSRP